MRLTGIEIERFGAWRNYSQELRPTGLNVIYGPNEAGKTTLLRFIRGVLYGYQPEDPPGVRRMRKPLPQSGSLRVDHRGRALEVRRVSHGDETGLVTIAGLNGDESVHRLLSEVVSGTDEKLFESVFAVGLPELQEFATLTEDEVARHLYGMTLGPQGQLLMDLPRKIDGEMERLWPAEGNKGRIAELTEQHRDLSQQMQGLRPQRDRYRTLLRQRSELERKIAGLRKQQGDLQHQTRSLQFFEKIHGPWSRIRELKRELATIPDLRTFPTDGLSLLSRWETDRDAALKTRDDLHADLRSIANSLRSYSREDGIRRYAGSIRSLQDQRAQWADLHQQLVDLEARALEHDRALAGQLAQIGTGWTVAKLDATVDTPEAHARFVKQARDYQQIRLRTNRRQRKYRKLSQSSRDREMMLRANLQELGVEGQLLDAPIDLAKARLAQLTELGELQLESRELKQRSRSIDDQMQRLHDRLGIPDWAWLVLSFFVIAGLALFFAGLSAGVTTGWLVGLIYVVLAATAGGTTWALKIDFDRNIERQVAELRDQRHRQDGRRNEIDVRIRELVQQYGLWNTSGLQPLPIDATDSTWLTNAAERIAQLELAHAEHQRIQDLRAKLSLFRGELRTDQRLLTTAKRSWCESLKALGYDETLDVDQAFAQWQAIAQARETRHRASEARREARGMRDDYERFRGKVEDLGKRMRVTDLDFSNPFAALDRWEGDLRAWIVGRQEYRRLLKDRKLRRVEADDYQSRVDGLQTQITGLLGQAQATDRQDLEHKLQLFQRRKQIETSLQQATRELESLTQAEPNLAIVEDDLVRFRPQDQADTLKRLARDAAEIEQRLQELFEQLGTIKQEVKALANDRQASRVRFELSQRHEQLHEAWSTWYSDAIGSESVDLVGAMFEQAHQPEMLAAAIPFVEQLTCGKYRRLWTQLGRRQLFVDDDTARPRPAEQLSGGTREQLFLAIRLAMVQAFRKQSIELPLVLDDVTVNFDVTRSEAAVKTLMDFAKDGQQVIVFTSHLYFAQMFQKEGIEPIFLPARGRGDERLAG